MDRRRCSFAGSFSRSCIEWAELLFWSEFLFFYSRCTRDSIKSTRLFTTNTYIWYICDLCVCAYVFYRWNRDLHGEDVRASWAFCFIVQFILCHFSLNVWKASKQKNRIFFIFSSEIYRFLNEKWTRWGQRLIGFSAHYTHTRASQTSPQWVFIF